MDADERDICYYLKGFPGQYVSGTEISRRAGGKLRFRQDPQWAAAPLARLVDNGIIESDADGHYRLKKRERKKKPKHWLSPQMKKILEASGKQFDGVFEIEDDDELEHL